MAVFSADLELCLVHPVHDHVKRENIFCITTANGNAYYLQVCHKCSRFWPIVFLLFI